MADVIATICSVFWTDVTASRLMELPTMGVDGRWNSHWVNVLVLILMFCAGPHPIHVADGTCQNHHSKQLLSCIFFSQITSQADILKYFCIQMPLQESVV